MARHLGRAPGGGGRPARARPRPPRCPTSSRTPPLAAAHDLAAVCDDLGLDARRSSPASRGAATWCCSSPPTGRCTRSRWSTGAGLARPTASPRSTTRWAVLAPPRFDGLHRRGAARPAARGVIPAGRTRRSRPRLANLQVHVDGTVAPWLTRERHRAILDSCSAHRPARSCTRRSVPGAARWSAGDGATRRRPPAAAALPHAELRRVPRRRPRPARPAPGRRPPTCSLAARAEAVTREPPGGHGLGRDRADHGRGPPRHPVRAAGAGPPCCSTPRSASRMNADDITAKAVAYFAAAASAATVDAARLAHPADGAALDRQLAAVPHGAAGCSPGPAARRTRCGMWAGTGFRRRARRRRDAGRHGDVRSAAALTLGVVTRAGLRDLQGRRRPRVGAGLDLLERLTGLRGGAHPALRQHRGRHPLHPVLLPGRAAAAVPGGRAARRGRTSSASTSTPR